MYYAYVRMWASCTGSQNILKQNALNQCLLKSKNMTIETIFNGTMEQTNQRWHHHGITFSAVVPAHFYLLFYLRLHTHFRSQHFVARLLFIIDDIDWIQHAFILRSWKIANGGKKSHNFPPPRRGCSESSSYMDNTHTGIHRWQNNKKLKC